MPDPVPGPPFVVPFLDLLWILVRFMVQNPQNELQLGVQVALRKHGNIAVVRSSEGPTSASYTSFLRLPTSSMQMYWYSHLVWRGYCILTLGSMYKP